MESGSSTVAEHTAIHPEIEGREKEGKMITQTMFFWKRHDAFLKSR